MYFFKAVAVLCFGALFGTVVAGPQDVCSKENPQSVEILSQNLPPKVIVDFPYHVTVKILNNDRFWPRQGKTRLSYHLLDTKGNLVAFEFDRTTMPQDVKKGDTVEIQANVYIPKGKVKPGKYILQWDLVEEGIKWYSRKNLINKSEAQVEVIEKDLYGSQIHPGPIGLLKFLFGVMVVLGVPGILLAVFIIPEFEKLSLVQRFVLSCLLGFIYCNIINVLFSLVSFAIRPLYYLIPIFILVLFNFFFFHKNNSFLLKVQLLKRHFEPNPKNNVIFTELISTIPGLLAAALIILVWRDYITFPSIFDLTTHASFVRKIYDSGLSLGSQVYGPEVPWTIPGQGFYPLCLHRTVAMVSHFSSLNPVFCLFYFIVFLCFCAPITLQIFLQNYFHSQIHILLVGLAAALYSVFPYEPMSWGGAPLIAATVLMPGLLYMVQYFVESPNLRLAFGIGLLSSALFDTHPPELYTAAIISIFLLIRHVSRVPADQVMRPNFKKLFIFGFASVCIALLVLLPELRTIIHTQMARAGDGFIRVPDHWRLRILFSKLHLYPLNFETLMVYLGAGYVLWRKKFRVLLLIAIFFIGMNLIENYINTPLGNLWNHRVARIYYNSYIFNPVLIGSGLYIIYRIFQHGDYRFFHRGKSMAFFALVLFLVFLNPGYDKVKRQLNGYFKKASGMTNDDYEAIVWLDQNANDTPITVLNQHGDSSFWIYPFTGIPIFLHRTDVNLPYPDIPSRVRLQQAFADGDFSFLKNCAKKYDLKYVYISKNIVPLENSPYKRFSSTFFNDKKELFRLVFSNPTVRIYEIII